MWCWLLLISNFTVTVWWYDIGLGLGFVNEYWRTDHIEGPAKSKDKGKDKVRTSGREGLG